jgi:hypothetical protein
MLAAGMLLAGCENPAGGSSSGSGGPGDDGVSVSLGPEQVIAATGGQASDEFGWSVATSGDVVIAGAPGVDGVNALNRGAAYFFERDGDGSWTPADSADGDAGADQFGFSTAVDGDYAVIGAPRPDASDGLEYVKIFARQGDGSWSQIEKPIDETTTHDDFGHSVDISGLRVIAGAPRADDLPGQSEPITNAGLAYIIDEQGLTPPSWPEGPSHTLEASDPAEDDWFGHAVAIDGGTAVVGAPGEGGHANKAYVFELQGNGTWEEQQILAPSSPQSAGGFGWSVAIDGDTIAVGAPYEDSAFGAAYLYQQAPDGSWSPAGRVVASDRSEDASFGIRVSLDGGLLLVGAEFGPDLTFTGRAYLFSRNSSGAWGEAVAFSATDLAAGDRFGRGADISGENVVMGAPGRETETGATDGGEVFVYSR